MCEARDAIEQRKRAAQGLIDACAEHCGVIASAFLGVLADPVPDALKRLADEAERRLGREH